MDQIQIEEKYISLRKMSVLFFCVFQSMYAFFFSFYYFDGNQTFHPALLVFGIVPIVLNFFLCLSNRIFHNFVYAVVACYILFRTLTIYYIKDQFFHELILGFLILEWLSYFVLLYVYLILYMKFKSFNQSTEYSPVL